MSSVLLVDDDTTIGKLFNLLFEQRNDPTMNLAIAESGSEAIDCLTKSPTHVVILDLRMKDGDGFSVLDYLTKASPDTSVIVLTNYNFPAYRERCKTYSCVKDFFIKYTTRMDDVVDLAATLLKQRVAKD